MKRCHISTECSVARWSATPARNCILCVKSIHLLLNRRRRRRRHRESMEGRPRTPANVPPSSTNVPPPPPPSLPPPSSVSSALPSSAMAIVPTEPTTVLPSTQKQSLENISASIQRSLALLHQIHCSVSSFTLPSQLTLLERLYVFSQLLADKNVFSLQI